MDGTGIYRISMTGVPLDEMPFMVDSCLNHDRVPLGPIAPRYGCGFSRHATKGCPVHEFQILTLSSSLPMGLMDELLTRTESVLEDHGASRVWIDQSQPGLTVLAEFPATDATPGVTAHLAEFSPLV